MQALIIIGEEHRNLWRIATFMEKVVNELGDEDPESIARESQFFMLVFDYLEQFMDACHHTKEDDYLFPALKKLANSENKINEILNKLQTEHLKGPVKLDALREKLTILIKNPKNSDAYNDFVKNLHKYAQAVKDHINNEEKEIMPLAQKLISAKDWESIDAAFLDNDDPLFGKKASANYRELFRRVVYLVPLSSGLDGQYTRVREDLPLSATPQAKKTEVAEPKVLLSIKAMESCYGRIKALKGIDLEVYQGELVALVGANGAGKTTFLRTLSGVQPMSSGTIEFNDEDISRCRSDKRVKKGICQSPEGRQVFSPLSVEDNLLLGGFLQPKNNVIDDIERIYNIFPILREKRNLPAGTLSGGQQQMLAIGRAMMGRPKLLLLDEPSMGLAPLLVEEVFNIIKKLKSEGMTILLVEQNAFASLAIADRGYVLQTGEITINGTGDELLNNAEVRASYLGM